MIKLNGEAATAFAAAAGENIAAGRGAAAFQKTVGAAAFFLFRLISLGHKRYKCSRIK